MGLYSVTDTTGKTLQKVVLDVLLRLGLPLQNLRAITFDGAANMSGAYNGAQALIREQQPLALYVHCGAHCVNLALQSSLKSSAFVADTIQLVHELGVLYGKSSKFRTVFDQISKSTEVFFTLKPLCPTRWTVRTPALAQFFRQYESVITALEEISDGGTHISNEARGFLTKFSSGNVWLGLQLAYAVMEPIELLNKALQGKTQTVSGMFLGALLIYSVRFSHFTHCLVNF